MCVGTIPWVYACVSSFLSCYNFARAVAEVAYSCDFQLTALGSSMCNIHMGSPNLPGLLGEASHSFHSPPPPETQGSFSPWHFMSHSNFNAIHVSFQLTIHSIFHLKKKIQSSSWIKPGLLAKNNSVSSTGIEPGLLSWQAWALTTALLQRKRGTIKCCKKPANSSSW